MENEQVVVNETAASAEQTEVRENREPREQRERAPFRNKRRQKVCAFCDDKVDIIDYKDPNCIRKNLSEQAKIIPRRVTGSCARHHRQLTIAVKRARTLAPIPYITD